MVGGPVYEREDQLWEGYTIMGPWVRCTICGMEHCCTRSRLVVGKGGGCVGGALVYEKQTGCGKGGGCVGGALV
jgi:hypothetical protein